MKNILAVAAFVAFASGCVSYVDREEVKPYSISDVKSAPATDRPYVEGATLRPLRVLVSMDGGNDEGDSRADPVPQGEFLLCHNLQMYN